MKLVNLEPFEKGLKELLAACTVEVPNNLVPQPIPGVVAATRETTPEGATRNAEAGFDWKGGASGTPYEVAVRDSEFSVSAASGDLVGQDKDLCRYLFLTGNMWRGARFGAAVAWQHGNTSSNVNVNGYTFAAWLTEQASTGDPSGAPR